MSKAISSLLEALKVLYKIEPAYYMNWSLFKVLLANEIHVILKDRGIHVNLILIFYKLN